MNSTTYICRKHQEPILWAVPDDLPPKAKESAIICPCGETGAPDTTPKKSQEQLKSGVDVACSLLERWYGSPTQDPTLQKDTYDFLVGPV
jgi:hypothetical protein